MVCDNCITEGELDPAQHIILDGPFDSPTECLNSSDAPKAFFSVGNDTTITNLVIKLTDQNLIDSAIRQISGLEPEKYIRGNIVDEFAWYNPEYLYHVDPSSIYFVEIEALANNQQNLDSYSLQAGGQLPGNIKVKGQVSPKQPDCEGCANTVYIGWRGYCTCADGTQAQECLTEDCGVYITNPNDPKNTIWKEKHICVSGKPHPDYEWNNNLCQWVCPGADNNKSVDQVKRECEDRSIYGMPKSWYTFKPETCECVPPTTCAPCPSSLKRRPHKKNDQSGYIYVSEADPCTDCICIDNLCGPKGIFVENTTSCECQCNEETACPGELKELVAVNKWTPNVAGAELNPPCDCQCTNICSSPLILDPDDCSCNCPSSTMYKCEKNGETLCVECFTSIGYTFDHNTCSCECETPCTPPKTRIAPQPVNGIVQNPLCTCYCPEDDVQCKCKDMLGGQECSPNKEYEYDSILDTCRCVCKNDPPPGGCGLRKVWDTDKCECVCSSAWDCQPHQDQDPDTCECTDKPTTTTTAPCPILLFENIPVMGYRINGECQYVVSCYRCNGEDCIEQQASLREDQMGTSCSDWSIPNRPNATYVLYNNPNCNSMCTTTTTTLPPEPCLPVSVYRTGGLSGWTPMNPAGCAPVKVGEITNNNPSIDVCWQAGTNYSSVETQAVDACGRCVFSGNSSTNGQAACITVSLDKLAVGFPFANTSPWCNNPMCN